MVQYIRGNRTEKKLCLDLDLDLIKQSKNFATNNSLSLKLMVTEGLKLFMHEFNNQTIGTDIINLSVENQQKLIEINKNKAKQYYNLD